MNRPVIVLCLFAILSISPLVMGQDELILFYPRVQHNQNEQVGIAIANDSEEDAEVSFLFFQDSGALFGNTVSPPFMNTVTKSLLPKTQESWTLPELFGDGSVDKEGFILVFSDNIAVVGFFLTYSPNLSHIDGAEAIPLNSFTDSIVFPEVVVGNGRQTRLNIIAFVDDSHDLVFELVRDGAALQTKTLQVGPSASQFPLAGLSRTLDEIFQEPISEDAFVRVSSSTTVFFGYEDFGNDSVLGGRNAIPTPISRPVPFSLFGAQAASTENPEIRTRLTLINAGDLPASLNIQAFPTGVPAGSAGELTPVASIQTELSPGSTLKQDLKGLLGLTADFEGWLRVDSNVTGIIGNATFGDGAGNFLSSVQLQASPVQEIVFSHVADGRGFFTGVTLLNFLPDPSTVFIEVFKPDGTRSAPTSEIDLAPFEHRPDTLTELVSGLEPQVEGFIRIRAPQGIFSFELFGYAPKGLLWSLSTVPPQRGNGIILGQLQPTEASALPTGFVQALRAARQVNPKVSYPASLAKRVTLQAEHPIRPGEVIVKYRSGYSAPARTGPGVGSGLRVVQTAPENVALLKSERIETPGPLQTRVMAASDLGRLKLETFDLIEDLNGDPDVVYAQPNYIYQAMQIPNDPLYPYQWHYSTLNLEAVWEITTGNPNVIIAVVDTGAKISHPDLAARLTAGQFDFISDPQVALDGDGMDGNADDPGDDPTGLGSSFHGTHVAGTVGAVTNNGTGVAGVNWNSPLMTLRVLGAGGGSSFDIAQAILYAVRLPNVSGQLPPKAAQVINLSLGGPGAGPLEQDAVQEALARGAIIVAAAGNENSSVDNFPAAFPGVFSIGALDRLGEKAPYSNFGPHLDFMMPGGDLGADKDGDGFLDGVLSTLWDENDGLQGSPDYRFYQGTSMATPHAAGVISLMLSVNPSLNRDQVELILRNTAIDLGPVGRDDTYGYGAVEPLAAIATAADISSSDPLLVVSPSLLNFGSFEVELSVKLLNAGGGQLNVNTPSLETDSGGSWLSAILSGPTGPLTVTVTRTGLPDGDYTGRVRLVSNGGSGTVEVRMTVGVKAGEDIGPIFILALDPRTFESEGQGIALFEGLDGEAQTPEDSYTYRTEPVPAGLFLLVAGTDLDDDGYICDEGEFCGWFPVSNQPRSVRVSSGAVTPDIDFIVERDAPVGGAAIESAQPDRGFPIIRKDSKLNGIAGILKERVLKTRDGTP